MYIYGYKLCVRQNEYNNNERKWNFLSSSENVFAIVQFICKRSFVTKQMVGQIIMMHLLIGLHQWMSSNWF